MNKEKIRLYHPHDFVIESSANHDNPFMTDVFATFEHESGETIGKVPGFYNGNGRWVIRFSPTRIGTWRATTSAADAQLDGRGLACTCVQNTNPAVHGTLRIDRANPKKFAWRDGAPFLLLGFECDWLFSYHQRHPDDCAARIALLSDRGFNYIVTNIYAHTGFSTSEAAGQGEIRPDTIYGPPDMYVFGGDNDNADHSRLNVAFFADYDRMMHILFEKGIVAHLMIQVQNKSVSWPKRNSAEDDLFWNYVVARYQAYGNVVWDISKESFYLYKETGAHDYAVGRMHLIRRRDAYNHLVTIHDPMPRSTALACAADEAADFVSDQIHCADTGAYNREAILSRRLFSKPYVNIEYGYELGAENLKTYTSTTTASWEKMLEWTYALYLAGAYPCYYYSNTSWDLIEFDPEPEGWKRYRYLADFIGALDYNRMEPCNELVARGFCLAEPGKAYLLFLPEGGDAQVSLHHVESKRGWAGRPEWPSAAISSQWMDIRSGARVTAAVEIPDSGAWNTRIVNPLDDKNAACVVAVRA
jgi:hypothetical protein